MFCIQIYIQQQDIYIYIYNSPLSHPIRKDQVTFLSLQVLQQSMSADTVTNSHDRRIGVFIGDDVNAPADVTAVGVVHTPRDKADRPPPLLVAHERTTTNKCIR